jgi:mRNA degradation ribonuclease J1/J2
VDLHRFAADRRRAPPLADSTNIDRRGFNGSDRRHRRSRRFTSATGMLVVATFSRTVSRAILVSWRRFGRKVAFVGRG